MVMKINISSFNRQSFYKSLWPINNAKSLRKFFLTTFGIIFFMMLFFVYAKNTEIRFYMIDFLSKHGLTVQKISLEGLRYTDEAELKKSIEISIGDSIFKRNPHELQKIILSLPWIKAATVRRELPSSLIVSVVEQYPIALWQRKNHISVIDDSGSVIDQAISDDLENDLLVVTGEDAPKATPDLLEALRAYPELKRRVTGALFIGKRRWDIIIDNKLRIKLPEINIEEGLDFFQKLEKGYNLQSQDIAYVDVRNGQKAYVRHKHNVAEEKVKARKSQRHV
jgi:cell division protein FtsQ